MIGTRAGVVMAALSSVLAPGPSEDRARDRGPVVAQGDPSLQTRLGVLYRSGAPFSGVVEERSGGRLLARTPHVDGRAEGIARGLYPGGERRYQRLYRGGHKEGTHRGWWPNGNLQFVYRYRRDTFEGEQLGYYKNGATAELRHYRDGHEEGRQTTWDGDGRISTNYVFRDGRRYGIVGRFDCVTVHDR